MNLATAFTAGQAVRSRAGAAVPVLRQEAVLASRVFALAVVSACGAFLPAVLAHPGRFIGGVVCGALLTLVEYVRTRAGRRLGLGWIAPHVVLWTCLVALSGGQRSPLFLGYLLEIPIAGVLNGRRGIAAAAMFSAAAITLLPLGLGGTYQPAFVAAALAFLAVVAALASWLIGLLERQRLEIARAHEALRRRADSLAEELRLLGDYLNDGLIAIDPLGRVVSINRAGALMLGLESSAVNGAPWQQILAAAPPGLQALTRAIADASDARSLRLLLTARGRVPRYVEADVWTGPSPQGTRTYVLFGPPQSTDQGALDPLRRLGEAAACVSHQIKNSLHALRGFALQLDGEHAAGAASPSAAQLLRALGTLGELAEDVLAMSGAHREPEARLPLLDVVSSAVTLARRSDARVEVRAPVTPVFVCAHRGRLVHALFNLIDNACRVTPAGGLVEVAVRSADGRAWVEILDRGPGLPVECRAAPDRGTPRQGSGYGLIAARRFLEDCGGSLEFERAQGGGTRCRVSLQSATSAQLALTGMS